ncbi:hypothetical protein N431DRAFT_433587 [Stipitochalara longipes BDJ]|nr:hypothetical protein N431DRAFT_433587 [Stipitochalara longipes BDJ]
MLNFTFCEGRQIGAGTYNSQPIDINELQDTTDVLERIRSQSGNLELEEGSQGYLWHDLATTPPIEGKLGHIPVAVVKWRETEILETGRRTSIVEVICRVDASRIPPHHPLIFGSSSPSRSIIRRLRTWGGLASSPNPSCQTQNSTAQCPVRAEDKTSHLARKICSCVTCLGILLLFAVFLALSLFLGIFFTVKKSYGNSMGDAWTLAGYVVAVGTACTSMLGIYHCPHCTCWRVGTQKTCTE